MPEFDTRKRLAQIIARAGKATEGPWKLAKGFLTVYNGKAVEDATGILRRPKSSVDVLNVEDPELVGGSKARLARDLHFIVAARVDVPWLCEELAKALGRIAELEAQAGPSSCRLECQCGASYRVVGTVEGTKPCMRYRVNGKRTDEESDDASND